MPNIVEFADVDNELRNIVEDVWSDVLRLDDETIRHFDGKNFFDLGGNSLMLFQVAKRLLNKWNIKVSISELLSNILFEDLVSLIKKNNINKN
ncbi:TPA: acyl carrier protein, partial [Streptococcus equi subsp. zooepidemicus]|nr:acyl carrier protein [Streptococcus equi subsp. zooepidemicus]HEL1325183.1 acyl carrier protein [Streptococcus equi subsp. zooepidemicus]